MDRASVFTKPRPINLKPLEPFGHAVADMERRVEKMTAPQLRALDRACGAVTTGNCWWASYRAVPLVREFIAAERMRRRVAKSAATPRPASAPR